jgi:glycerol-3-phosphate O-acyltransferase
MARDLAPEDAARLDDWVAQVASALSVDLAVPTSGLLKLAAEVAHGVLRPAAPVTGFLVGAALAASPQLSADEVLARVRSLLEAFPPGGAEPGTTA